MQLSNRPIILQQCVNHAYTGPALQLVLVKNVNLVTLTMAWLLGWFEFFWKCWSSRIFVENSLYSSLKIVCKTKTIKWVPVLWTEQERSEEKDQTCFSWQKDSTVPLTATPYNCGEQNSVLECTTHQTLRWMGCNSRRTRCVPILSAKKRNLRLQWGTGSPNLHSLRLGKCSRVWWILISSETHRW